MSDFPVATAIEAARRVAMRVGLGKVVPRLLSVSEHAILRLSPAPIVARVRRGIGAEEAMSRELAVVRHLAEREAPVLAPLLGLEAGPYCEANLTMTFWNFVPHVPAGGENRQHRLLAAKALDSVHDAFADYAGWLPAFEEKIAFSRALIEVAPPALSAEDRHFLLAVHDEIRFHPRNGCRSMAIPACTTS